jgi:hypothetical protein
MLRIHVGKGIRGQEYGDLALHVKQDCPRTPLDGLFQVCPCGQHLARFGSNQPHRHFGQDKTVEEHLLRMLVEKP